jgi:hypothetical protein
MAKFLYAYTGGGGMAGTPEEQKQLMDLWGVWMGGLGAALVDGGAPFSESKAADGSPGKLGLTGYSLLEAGSLDEAVAKTAGCPIFDAGGNVEVYEAIEM